MGLRIVAANANHFAAIGHYVANGHRCPTLEGDYQPRFNATLLLFVFILENGEDLSFSSHARSDWAKVATSYCLCHS